MKYIQWRKQATKLYSDAILYSVLCWGNSLLLLEWKQCKLMIVLNRLAQAPQHLLASHRITSLNPSYSTSYSVSSYCSKEGSKRWSKDVGHSHRNSNRMIGSWFSLLVPTLMFVKWSIWGVKRYMDDPFLCASPSLCIMLPFKLVSEFLGGVGRSWYLEPSLSLAFWEQDIQGCNFRSQSKQPKVWKQEPLESWNQQSQQCLSQWTNDLCQQGWISTEEQSLIFHASSKAVLAIINGESQDPRIILYPQFALTYTICPWSTVWYLNTCMAYTNQIK